ncbi:hypothetical protein FJY94_06585 [Candidatus Kaiserbacteria bacterium]|nr:hypothetical protein [Candidatus Kaiserbacteria bacterium]
MTFDADVFMNTAVSGSNDTRVAQADPGEYLAVADSIEFDTFAGKSDKSLGKTFYKLRVKWSIDDAGVKEALGRDKVTVAQDMFLDMTDGGSLDMGKGRNVSLGRLREAIGQNDPARPWSPNMIVGAVAKVKVEHEVVKGEIYAKVTGVTKS